MTGRLPGKPAYLWLWYSDGSPLPEDTLSSCSGLRPTAFKCNYGATVEDCQRQVQAYLDVWYADFNLVFTLTRPPSGDYYAMMITSEGTWCQQTSTTEAGVAPFNCNDNPGQSAFAFECGYNAHACATLIAHEHGHMVGLEHTVSTTDVMNQTILSTATGFDDSSDRVLDDDYNICDLQNQNSYRVMLAALGDVAGRQQARPACRPTRPTLVRGQVPPSFRAPPAAAPLPCVGLERSTSACRFRDSRPRSRPRPRRSCAAVDPAPVQQLPRRRVVADLAQVAFDILAHGRDGRPSRSARSCNIICRSRISSRSRAMARVGGGQPFDLGPPRGQLAFAGLAALARACGNEQALGQVPGRSAAAVHSAIRCEGLPPTLDMASLTAKILAARARSTKPRERGFLDDIHGREVLKRHIGQHRPQDTPTAAFSSAVATRAPRTCHRDAKPGESLRTGPHAADRRSTSAAAERADHEVCAAVRERQRQARPGGKSTSTAPALRSSSAPGPPPADRSTTTLPR
jgi:hypothetical protein